MTAFLIPELYVRDLDRSLNFYCELLGFQVQYERPDERFAYVAREGAELMLEEPVGRVWLSAPLVYPFGVGANFQIQVSDAEHLHTGCLQNGIVVLCALEVKRYKRGETFINVRQFVIQDPDGYLLRFSESV